MQSQAKTVKEYLDSLPPGRRKDLAKVRAVVRKHLPKGYVETMNWGMISYEVPLSVCPDTYNGQPLAYAGIASQKNHVAIYLMGIYTRPGLYKKLERAYAALGEPMNVGKSCIRFTSLEKIPLTTIGDIVAAIPMEEYVAMARRAADKSPARTAARGSRR